MAFKARLFKALRNKVGRRLARASVMPSLRRRIRSSARLGDLAWIAIKKIAEKVQQQQALAEMQAAPVEDLFAPEREEQRLLEELDAFKKRESRLDLLIQQSEVIERELRHEAKFFQLDMFWYPGMEEDLSLQAEMLREEHSAKIKRGIKRAKRYRRAQKALQYKVKLEIRKTERKLRFVRKAPKEKGGNTEVFSTWEMRKIHAWVLRDALCYLRECLQIGSNKAAEVWDWMSRRGMDEEFSFESCLRIAADFPEEFDGLGEEFLSMDPDEVRKLFAHEVRQRFGAVFPHRQLLKNAIVDAEMSGDPNAIRWILSDSEAPLSFIDCCNALGFDPEEARESISLPQTETTTLVAVAA